MRPNRVSALFVLSCVATLLLASTAAKFMHAQSPAAGTTVAVKLAEAVDSVKDPAGKQYRASVTKAVNAGNGVVIQQGALAVVSLTNGGNGSGLTTQLVFVAIDGQPVAVKSGPASLTSAAQNAAAGAMNSINSVLGGFGHHVSAPAAAVATGQHVVLPPGVTLTFVLTKGPEVNASTAQEHASQPVAASAAPAPAAASSDSASNGVTAMEICFSNPRPNPSDPNHLTEYLTAVFEVPVSALRAIPALEPAFADYLKTTYHYAQAAITCQPIWSVAEAESVQKKIATDHDPRVKMIDTGWRYGQPPVNQGQSGFDPLTTGQGGLDLKQHRLTTYYCTLTADGGTSQISTDPSGANRTAYVSQIFQADWDAGPVNVAWYAYIRDHYVHDLSGVTVGPGVYCIAQNPAIAAMQHPKAGVSKLIHHIVPVNWTYTPGQASPNLASSASGSAAQHAGAASHPASGVTGGPFISCSTTAGPGVDTYFTGVFQTTRPVRQLPNGAHIVDQSILDDFHAFLTKQGYNFKPGKNNWCDVKPTEAQAQAAQHTRAYGGGGGLGVNCCGNGKVVETGWKE